MKNHHSGTDSWRHRFQEDFRTVTIICCVWGKDTHIDHHISNTQTLVLVLVLVVVGRVEMSIPVLKILKINFLWDMTNSIQYLVLFQFQKSIYLPHNPSKNTGSICLDWLLCRNIFNPDRQNKRLEGGGKVIRPDDTLQFRLYSPLEFLVLFKCLHQET